MAKTVTEVLKMLPEAVAQFFHFVAEEKKKTKKQRHFMTGLPQISQ